MNNEITLENWEEKIRHEIDHITGLTEEEWNQQVDLILEDIRTLLQLQREETEKEIEDRPCEHNYQKQYERNSPQNYYKIYGYKCSKCGQEYETID